MIRPLGYAYALFVFTCSAAIAQQQPASTAPLAAPQPPAPVAAAPQSSTPQAIPASPPQANTVSEEPVASKDSPPPTAKKISLGNSNVSIFFVPEQIQAVRNALEDYESRPPSEAPAAAQITLEELQKQSEPPKVEEPPLYPVFYLSSIAFESNKDWSVWVSGHKITSKRNITDLDVLSVSKTHASFAWKPKFAKALTARNASKQFAQPGMLKSRLAPKQSLNHGADYQVVTFSLGINQTFSPAHMRIFEGFVESVPLEKLVTPSPAATDASTPLASPAAPHTAATSDVKIFERKTIFDRDFSKSGDELKEQLNRITPGK